MCGITGFVSTQYREHDLECMTDALRHRGPDAKGYFYQEKQGIGLGHRRLSILDLSENANQPFHSQAGQFVTVYNGELYNYREIAQQYGLNLRTSSDTEVIIERFTKDGEKSLEDFNGMFAFAVWDKIDEKLYLIRDRVGIKPLFYYFDGRNFAFASEIKALLQLPIDKSLNKEALVNFLYLGYFPQEQSIFKHIKKLPAGSVGIFHKSSFSIKSYWSLSSKIEETLLKDEKIAKAQLKKRLIDSIKGQVLSDVPLGTFLSGGIDSSTVTALAQHLSDKPVKTFSIGFKDAKFNEAHHARAVADYLKTDHHEFMLSEKDALDKVQNLLDIYDEPFGDSSAIPTLLVSEMARKYVTVTLSGDGGDELFQGYGTYTWAKRLDNPLIKTLRYPLSIALKISGNERLKRRSEVFSYSNKERMKSHIFSQEQYLFSEKTLDSLLINKAKADFEETTPYTNRPLSKSEEQAFFDFQNYLKDDLLVKVDRASMYYGLETRVPLLDHKIVEFAFNLDENLKYKQGESKYLLKQVLYDYVPASYFKRPKQGFSIPLGKWLKTDLRYLIEEHLSEESVRQNNICRYDRVKELKEAYFKGEDYLYNRLWVLVLLHKWLNENT
jgi:asparagine synthase (glutamine-hydrolysing)